MPTLAIGQSHVAKRNLCLDHPILEDASLCWADDTFAQKSTFPHVAPLTTWFFVKPYSRKEEWISSLHQKTSFKRSNFRSAQIPFYPTQIVYFTHSLSLSSSSQLFVIYSGFCKPEVILSLSEFGQCNVYDAHLLSKLSIYIAILSCSTI